MMYNFFNFFPVGQGLFYYGSLNFGEFTFAYDCGTTTHEVDLSNHISKVAKLNGGNKLDFLAISHFHWDHVSGVEQLENLVGFKHVYLPYLSNNSMIRSFVIGIQLFEDTQEFDERRLSTYRFLINLYNRDNRNIEPGSGYISHPNWVFKYFNKEIKPKLCELLLEKIEKLLIKYSVADVIDLFRIVKFKELRKAYLEVFKNSELNDTSLLLLHYPEINNHFYETRYYPNDNGTIISEGVQHYFYPYTLLTGDILFDDNLAKDVINSYPTGVSGIVQVPHHGSKYNWPSLINRFPSFNCYVVNYGTTNKFGHPDYLLRTYIPSHKFFDNNEFNGFLYQII